MATYRERRMARAQQLRGWAEQREQRAGATLEALDNLPYAHDIAFLTQPGRIVARERMNAAQDGAFASLRKTGAMSARADAIESAADRAVYSDDPDAAERLTAKIASLEAERARVVAYNAACRKAGRVTADALALLDDVQRADVESLARIGFLRPDGAMPSYATSNLGGQISKARERLAALSAPRSVRRILARRGGACATCGGALAPGEVIAEVEPREWSHDGCSRPPCVECGHATHAADTCAHCDDAAQLGCYAPCARVA